MRKREQAANKDNSIEGLIAARSWPAGGLQELFECVKSKLQWARDACTDLQPCSTVYNQFMQLFMASIFACNKLIVCVHTKKLISPTPPLLLCLVPLRFRSRPCGCLQQPYVCAAERVAVEWVCHVEFF